MRLAVYGARQDGHAKVCRHLLEELGHDCAGWLEDGAGPGGDRGDLPLLGGRDDLRHLSDLGIEGLVLGFGLGRGRREVAQHARAAGVNLPTLAHPSSSVSRSVRFGEGCVVLRGALIGDDIELGRATLINVGAVLTHDNMVGDGASIGPGAVLAGRARVDRDAELGAGVVLLPDAHVGEGAIVGAGAVVTGSIAAGITAVGVPARPSA